MVKKKVENEPHIDIVGQELNVGDMVAFNPPGIKGLTIGTIKGFSPKSARILFVRYSYENNYNNNETSIAFNNILKVDEHIKTLFLLKNGGLVHRNKIVK